MDNKKEKPDILYGFLHFLLLAVTMFNICIFSYVGCEMIPWMMAGGFDQVEQQTALAAQPTPTPATPAPTPTPAEGGQTVDESQVSTPTGDLTMGQKNAMKAAESYLSLTAFSHSGLVKQLEFDGYSNEDSVYAADNCGADWNEQAAMAAKNYLDLTAFSREGLIEQLEFDGYTTEQAIYGADANGYTAATPTAASLASTPKPAETTPQNTGKIVYVSTYSNTIHSISDCSGMKNYREMSQSDADAKNYEYCENCW